MDKEAMKSGKSRGSILKEARELQGLTLEAVHEMTKVPLDVLRAIEEGYSVRTLSPFYVKAFVKKYAEFLKIDVTEIIQDYERKEGEAVKTFQPIPDNAIKKRNFGALPPKFDSRQVQRIAVSIGVGLFVLFLFTKMVGCVHHRSQESQARKKISLQPTATATRTPKIQPGRVERLQDQATEEGDAEVEVKVEPKKAVAEPRATKEVKTSKDRKESTAKAQPVSSEETVQAEAKRSAESNKNKLITLTIRAKKNGWLQVKVDGNLVYQSTIATGDTETWEAKNSIEISGKNIFYIDFELNGKVLGNLGRADRAARRVIITREGLSVKE